MKRLFLMILLAGFWSCGSEEESDIVIEDEMRDPREGVYTLHKGFRDGKETGTFRDAYFQIENSDLVTNLPGDTMSLDYVDSLSGYYMPQPIPSVLKIDSIKKDTLFLSSKIGGTYFDFVLLHAKN